MSFDTLAPWYRAMEAVSAGGLMQRCRTAFLPETKGCRRALLLGEGPGRFLVELLRANPQVEVTCVERSSRMIQEAIREVRRLGLDVARVRFENCDALAWSPLTRPAATLSPSDGERDGVRGIGKPDEQFDLVVTHFFLDCFRPDELDRLIAKVAASATDDARWLLADFRMPERGWQRWRARIALAMMYGFFRFTTGLSASRLTPPDGFLAAAGFRLAGQRLANFGLARSDLWLKTKA